MAAMNASTPDEQARLDEVDSLIAVHEELLRQAYTRRQRTDGTAGTLMTTAVALGAALVAAAKALNDPGPIAGPLGYIALGGLVGALVLGGASLATVVAKALPTGRSTLGPLGESE